MIRNVTRLLAFILAFFNAVEIVVIPRTSAVDELLAPLRRGVEGVTREHGTTVARFNGLTAAINAMDFVASLAIDERNAAVVARIGHTNGIGMMSTFSFKALKTADLWLNARIGADRTQSALL